MHCLQELVTLCIHAYSVAFQDFNAKMWRLQEPFLLAALACKADKIFVHILSLLVSSGIE